MISPAKEFSIWRRAASALISRSTNRPCIWDSQYSPSGSIEISLRGTSPPNEKLAQCLNDLVLPSAKPEEEYANYCYYRLSYGYTGKDTPGPPRARIGQYPGQWQL